LLLREFPPRTWVDRTLLLLRFLPAWAFGETFRLALACLPPPLLPPFLISFCAASVGVAVTVAATGAAAINAGGEYQECFAHRSASVRGGSRRKTLARRVWF
jgi:hypothetical protein